MSSRYNVQEEGIDGAKSDSDRSGLSGGSIVSSADTQPTGNMKRVAAKQMIERYYYQLTDGCGKPDCCNSGCASSRKFKFTNLTRDQAALEALQLFRAKADLCGDAPFKVAKNSSTEDATSSTSESVKSGCNVSGMGQESLSGEREGVSPVEGCSTATTVVTCAVAGSSAMDVATTVTDGASRGPPSVLPEAPKVEHLSESSLNEIIEHCEAITNWSRLIRTIGSVFHDPDSLIKSFLRSESPSVSKEELRSMEVDADKDQDEGGEDTEMESEERSSPSSPGGVTPSNTQNSPGNTCGSPNHTHVRLKEDEVSVDVHSLRRVFKRLFALSGSPFQNAMSTALRSLSRTIEMDLKYHQAYERNNDYLNIFVILFELLVMDTRGDLENAMNHIFRAVGLLPLAAQAKLARVWAKMPQRRLKDLLGFLHQIITLRILSNQWSSSTIFNDDTSITGAAKVMKVVYYASILGGKRDCPLLIEREKVLNREVEESLQELLEGAMGREKEKSHPREDPLCKELAVNPLDCRTPVIPWVDFVNDLISDGVRMEKDYANYKGDSDKFSFLMHPFLLTTAMKNLGMYYDSKIRMVNERRASLLQSMVNGAPSMPYLRIRIRRDHIIDDALVNLEMVAMDNPQDLKKQLYVEFEGEQGIDEGGVSKEFFQLVLDEIFNPDIGMFTYDEETRNFWFNSTSFENDSQFTLIGIVLGLAIYNNVILDIHFPMVVYRKLMGKLGIFDDLKDSHPTLAKSLQDMLDYADDVQETFMQTFGISYTDVFGSTISHNLKPDGDKIPVTNANRQEFVDIYADFLLNKSIEKQFRAFKRGFHMVTDESPLKVFFQPEEVELLVCGSKNFDFHALEEATEYDGGFTANTPIIRYFWEIVHDFSEDEQRKVLQFATGSDRVPVGGLSKLKLVIARHGPDSDRLPTAHTCFNVLLLPDYTSKDKLRERLSKAINYAKGFGML